MRRKTVRNRINLLKTMVSMLTKPQALTGEATSHQIHQTGGREQKGLKIGLISAYKNQQ